MPDRTTLTVDEIVLDPVECDWVRQRLTCHAWTHPASTLLRPLMQAMATCQLKTCHLRPSRYDSRLPMPLSFAAYICAWQCREVRPGIHEHTITLAMSGSPWRDDDVPVESHEALWDLMMPARGREKG